MSEELQYSDAEILQQFAEEESRNKAFNLLVRKYQRQIYKVVRRIVLDHDDANDVVQNTFLKIFRSLMDFRSDANLFTWMYRIATNESLNFIRAKRTKQFFRLEDTDPVDVEGTYQMGHDSNQTEKIIEEAILSLPEKQRAVFMMRYYDEMKYEDMSKILKTSEGGLKANYHHAVKKIEEYVKKKLNY